MKQFFDALGNELKPGDLIAEPRSRIPDQMGAERWVQRTVAKLTLAQRTFISRWNPSLDLDDLYSVDSLGDIMVLSPVCRKLTRPFPSPDSVISLELMQTLSLPTPGKGAE
jgi:hypothetical protein